MRVQIEKSGKLNNCYNNKANSKFLPNAVQLGQKELLIFSRPLLELVLALEC